jgi:hypothetical protein
MFRSIRAFLSGSASPVVPDEAGQDTTWGADGNSLEDIPQDSLHTILTKLSAKDVASAAQTSRLMR